MGRTAIIERKTRETEIIVEMELDGKGDAQINTGVGFFDHMLELFAKHGLFNLKVCAKGDLNVDAHHTVEDVGIVLGQVIQKALGGKESIKRYGASYVPMDEALARTVLDLGGRPFIVYEVPVTTEKAGEMDTQLIEEFFRAVAFNSGMNLHINVLYGKNNHHILEAVFKSFAKALDEATLVDNRIDGVMSTKGSI
ncbi:MAG: imidazoleglycerol-phosphate dehydratase HisB [Eubacteriales bacterium]|nr:imidazoleglycerol-phosphate dehydratase HisB [Eubacteriales bacterium]